MTQFKAGIESTSFGSAECGNVELFTLTNEQGMQVKVSTLGATLVSVSTEDKHGKFANIVLGMDCAEDYLADSAYLGRTIGPVANRIANARFSLDGNKYELEKNDGENCLHSGSTGLHNKLWSASHSITPQGCELVLTVKHGDLEGGFPGNKQFEVCYLLGHNNTLTISFFARSDKTTPVSLTNHAYFNLAGTGDVLAHQLRMHSNAITPVDSTLITTKEFLPVSGTPFDFEPVKTLGKELVSYHIQMQYGSGYDHNFVLEGEGGAFAILSEVNSGRRMTVSTDMPGVQLYTGNFVQGTRTAVGDVPFVKHAGVCLEAQNFPDAPNWPDRPDFWITPEKPYKAYIRFAFDVLSE